MHELDYLIRMNYRVKGIVFGQMVQHMIQVMQIGQVNIVVQKIVLYLKYQIYYDIIFVKQMLQFFVMIYGQLESSHMLACRPPFK